jgi:iron(III) transport system ATP-binding protein
MANLIVKHLVKRFGGVTAVDDVSLHVADGEFVSLLGPSGCGKSSTLAAIAGLDRPDSGEISAGPVVYFSGARNIWLPPEARGCGLVFQSYALWPHMTVYQNVAFPLKLRKVGAAEQKRRVEETLALVEMETFADRYPHQLSGGQQQRVALARTLSYKPAILLLDEPLSNLDAKLRDRARLWLAELRTKLKITTIYVTHDQVEALSLSDRIVVMNKGRIAQVGTPQEIYEHPADPFVADFIGTTNFLGGTVGERRQNGDWLFRLDDGQSIELDTSQQLTAGSAMTLALRPAQSSFCTGAVRPGETNVVSARVLSQSYVGARWQISLQVGKSALRLESDERVENGEVAMRIPRSGAVLFKGHTALGAQQAH